MGVPRNFNELFKNKILLIFIAGLMFGAISVSALRGNYIKMTELRTAVAVADEQDGDVEKALQNLRHHVISHMNTNLTSGQASIKPPIQLKYRYERLMATDQEQVKAYNSKVTADGEVICGSQYPGGGFNPPRVACVQDYVAKNSKQPGGVADDLYKFDFISPKWSPDLAGITMLISAGLLGVSLLAFVSKRIQRRHY